VNGQRRPWVRYGLVWLFLFSIAEVHALVAQPTADGDEPHYLLIARSLLHDGDLDLRDDYADTAQVHEVYPQAGESPLDPSTHAGRYVDRPELRPVHSIGVPIAIAPAVALGAGTIGVRMWMAFLSSLLWPVLLLVLDRMFRSRRRSHVVAVVAIAVTLPWLPYSSQLFPEPVGALFLVAGIGVMVCRPPTPSWSAIGASIAMALPWLHIRFSIFSLGLLIALLLRAGGAAHDTRSIRGLLRGFGKRPTEIAGVLVPVVLGTALLFLYNARLYGSLNPNAAYRVEPFTSAFEITPERVYEWGAADLLSPVFGVLPYGPVILLALAAVAVTMRTLGWVAATAAVVMVAYYVVATSFGKDGGWCPPGRFACVFIPLLAVPLAFALASSARARLLLVPLLAYGVALAVSATLNFSDLYTSQADRTLLPFARRAAVAWPHFPSRLPDRLSTTSEVHVKAEEAPRWLQLVAGHLRPGTYAAELVPAAGRAGGFDGAIAQMAVETLDGTMLASVPVERHGSGDVAALVFAAPAEPVQLIVRTSGARALERVGARIGPAAPGSVEERRLSDTVPMVALWAGVLLLLALAMHPSPRPVGDREASRPRW
jgi:hypothetical protein